MIYPWQHQVWDGLQRRLVSLPHALLIQGPQGVGKLALAEHLAQSLLCEAEDRRKAPCGACDGCRWFLAGSHPDFRRVEPEALARRLAVGDDEEAPAEGPASTRKPSNEIRIEQVRGLDGFLNHQSHRGGRRVALVHPAEAMNVHAANALLKSLEEPPGSAAFILVSHRAARLAATIRSRCVTVPVGIPPLESARDWLAGEKISEPERWLAYASGAPLKALADAQDAGPVIASLRQALQGRDLEALGAVNDREGLEALAEALQKYALDRAFASFSGRGKYGAAKPSEHGLAWLRFAREMGRSRQLARHPLNPRLFAGEMLAGMPED
ncbi:MAG: DNA polymerase III subunit delta' [Betaproteobacteria bacterium]|nr:DNA polymerase III subunit delta' [Betaproteobacteria bacterium]MDH5222377.1 DNA polymerase III subunit delta' [Betaproteobacteria bacterium]MDH5350705.1 DNA polymerase III subunit delta' [Betaproteobacteria bacterium]